MPKLPKPFKGTIIEDTLEAVQGIGKETVDSTKELPSAIAKASAKQISGEYQSSEDATQTPVSPSNQDIVDRLYGADSPNLFQSPQDLQKEKQKELEKQKRISHMRQKLKELIDPKKQTQSEQEEVQKKKQIELEEEQKKADKKLLPQVAPKGDRPKGMASLNPLAWKKYRASRNMEIKGAPTN